MSKKNKNRGLFLNAPEGVKVRRHKVGESIRFTIAAAGFRKLVAIAKGDKFSWVHKDFSA